MMLNLRASLSEQGSVVETLGELKVVIGGVLSLDLLSAEGGNDKGSVESYLHFSDL